jgi:hypothetical protein
MRHLTLSVLALLLLTPGAPVRGDEDAPAPPPQLKVLERFVGKWKVEAVVTVSRPEAKESRTAGKTEVEWVLGRRFVQAKSTYDTKVEDVQMGTYDVAAGEYRWWTFKSNGMYNESRGTWDEEARTFTWQGERGGVKWTNTNHFVDADTIEYDTAFVGRDGKTVMTVKGKLTRMK